MKELLILISVVLVLLCLTSCSNASQNQEETNENSSTLVNTTPLEHYDFHTERVLPPEKQNHVLPDAAPNVQNDDYVLSMNDCVGTWRKAPNESEGFSKVFSFWGDGTFVCTEYYNENSMGGNWSFEGDIIVLEAIGSVSGIEPFHQTLTVERTTQHGASGLLLNGELYLDIDEQILFYQAIIGQSAIINDFEGYWQRTRDIWENGAIIEITEQNDAEFHYDIFAMWLAQRFGNRNCVAYIVAPNQAFAYVEPLHEWWEYGRLLLFTLLDGELVIEYDGGSFGEGLGFGANVTANGFYTRDKPMYSNTYIDGEYPAIEDFRAGVVH